MYVQTVNIDAIIYMLMLLPLVCVFLHLYAHKVLIVILEFIFNLEVFAIIDFEEEK